MQSVTALLIAFLLLLGHSGHAQAVASPKPDSLLRLTDASCKWVKLRWATGNGQYHLVVLTENLTGNTAPVQGQSVTANPYFGAGGYTQAGGYAVYADTGRTATVQNLVKGRQYSALVYAYNASRPGTATFQLSRVPDTLRFTVPSCPDVTPAVPATRLRAARIDCSTLRLTCHPGSGQGRVFVMRKSSPATANTSAGATAVDNESFYPPSKLYARGLPNQSECYPVYAGTDTTVVVYGLVPDQLYKVAVYEYNTVPGPTGLPDGATPFYQQTNAAFLWPSTVACTGGEPGKSLIDDKQHQTCCARIDTPSLTPYSAKISWHPSVTPRHLGLTGSGAQMIPAGPQVEDGVGSYVVIRSPYAFNAIPLPLQNTVPAVVSTVYGQGSPVRPGEVLSYSVKLTQQWNDTTVTITGLQPSTPYIVDVFTFRYPDAGGTAPYTYFLSLPQASVSFFTPAVPLPVQLTSFTARRVGSAAQLSWATASELNNQGFSVERAVDGQTWQPLSFVAGQGTTQQNHTYTYSDQFTGAAYYRLCQRDNNQHVTYSPVCFVPALTHAAQLGLFPNPAHGSSLQVIAAANDEVMRLVTPVGKLVCEYPAGTQQLDVSRLAPGIYLVRQGAHTARLVIE